MKAVEVSTLTQAPYGSKPVVSDIRSYILKRGELKESKCCSYGVKRNAWNSRGGGGTHE